VLLLQEPVMGRYLVCCLLAAGFWQTGFFWQTAYQVTADETRELKPPARLLLLYQKPDGHPAGTHEYLKGLTRLQKLLTEAANVDVRLLPADEPWADGPDHLDGADGVVLFLAEGAKWVSADPARLAAFERLARRKGGLSCLHWAMGAKSAEPVPAFVGLFGACHGGPDRKYKFLETVIRPATPPLTMTSGIEPVRLKDEFYYDLKWPAGKSQPRPVMEAQIGERWWPVAWAWERPDGGRSFGFSGLHFDENWDQPAYRTLMVNGVLWTLQRD
jgi:Trehalose utilisation